MRSITIWKAAIAVVKELTMTAPTTALLFVVPSAPVPDVVDAAADDDDDGTN